MADRITSREQWLARRRRGVGGSDAPLVLLGRLYDRTVVDLAREKRGEIAEDDEPSVDMRRGSALEDDAVAEFERLTGLTVATPQTDEERWNEFWFDHPTVPYAYANLDGLLALPLVAPVEVKVPRSGNWYKIREEGLPDYWQIQAQHQMWVTGALRVHFWIFNADSWAGLHIVVERDDRIIEALAGAVSAFWLAVTMGVAPVAPLAPLAIAPLAAERAVLDVSASDDWRALLALYREVDARADAATAERDRVRDLVGDLLRALGVDVVRCGDMKAQRIVRKGSERLDRKALVAANPALDLRPFLSTSASSESLSIESTNRARGARGKGAKS